MPRRVNTALLFETWKAWWAWKIFYTRGNCNPLVLNNFLNYGNEVEAQRSTSFLLPTLLTSSDVGTFTTVRIPLMISWDFLIFVWVEATEALIKTYLFHTTASIRLLAPALTLWAFLEPRRLLCSSSQAEDGYLLDFLLNTNVGHVSFHDSTLCKFSWQDVSCVSWRFHAEPGILLGPVVWNKFFKTGRYQAGNAALDEKKLGEGLCFHCINIVQGLELNGSLALCAV